LKSSCPSWYWKPPGPRSEMSKLCWAAACSAWAVALNGIPGGGAGGGVNPPPGAGVEAANWAAAAFHAAAAFGLRVMGFLAKWGSYPIAIQPNGGVPVVDVSLKP